MKQDKKMNVIIYCRVSSDEQAEGTSLDVQEERLTAYCERKGYNIIDVPHREDESAKTFEKRPIIQGIMKYIRKHRGQVDKLLVLRWNRYSRDLFSACANMDSLRKLGVEVNSIEEPLDYTLASWPTQLGLYIGMAQGDNISRSKATIDGIRGTLKKGKCANKAPRGYKNVRISKHNTHVEIDEVKANMVRTAFMEVAKGVESPCRIRKRVCPQIPESSFFEMLRNVFYIGKIRIPAYKDEKEQVVEGVHEPLIDVETFYKVQEVIDGKRKKSPKLSKAINPDLYLRKYLVCPICGHSLTGSTSKGNGGRYTYYHCANDGKHLRKSADEVNEGFAKYVGGLKPNDVVLHLYREVLQDIRGEHAKESLKKVEALKRQVKETEEKLQVIDDKLCCGTIADETHERISEQCLKKIKELNQEIAILSESRKDVREKIDYSVNLINNLTKIMMDAPVKVKCKLLGSMFYDKIEYDGKNYRTKSYNKVLDLIYHETNKLRGDFTEKAEEIQDSSASVPRAGVEPARVAPLVFETSASTDSAIWACGYDVTITSRFRMGLNQRPHD